MKFLSKVGNKIVFFTGITLVAMAVVITTTFGIITYRASIRQTNELERHLMESFDLQIQSQVETALTMLQGFADKIESGELEDSEGRRMAADVLRVLFYGTEGYFWADTRNGTNVVLPGNRAVEGTNRIHLKDANGTEFIKDILEAGISGGGFIEYWFPKMGAIDPLPKRGYSKLFVPFDWVVGTGLYYDDIELIVGEIRTQREIEIRNTIFLVIFIAFIATLIGLAIAYIIGQRISRPIVELSDKTGKVSKGDLTVEVSSELNDEVGVLAQSISVMVGKLQQIVSEISEGADNVVSASQQMSGAAQVIADGAAEQAASTEEISTSMEEMVSSILQNTDNAEKTDIIASKSERSIVDLKVAFADTLEAMEKITAKSIIIKDISFQTNILALNAAVEAARAGDAGRGFSVVAGEVRKLSENTRDAAFEIDDLTKTSLEVARHAWELLEKLVPEFQETSMLVKEISASGLEQKVGADLINNAVQSMVQVTNQNSAASEELASSSEELAAQAETLKETVSFFRLR